MLLFLLDSILLIIDVGRLLDNLGREEEIPPPTLDRLEGNLIARSGDFLVGSGLLATAVEH